MRIFRTGDICQLKEGPVCISIIALSWIFGEALNNATRHARAKSIRVELETVESSLELSICDDGVGFDEPAKRASALKAGSLGLISMEERARLAGGQLQLHTTPGAGTRVVARFPLDAAGAESARALARIQTQ